MTDKDKLQEVLRIILLVLGRVVDSREVLFHKDLKPLIEGAWKELNSVKNEIEEGIKGAKPSDLKKRGLAGKRLELETFVFHDSYNDLERMGGLKRLKRFFKSAGAILESLGSVVPGGGMIKEFLIAVEIGIEKAEE